MPENKLMDENETMEYMHTYLLTTKNPKKLLKAVKGLIGKVSPNVHRGFICSALTSDNLVEYITTCYDQMIQLTTIIPELIEKGHHGLIMDGKTVYPITIDTRKNWLRENDKWPLEQEIEIQYALVDDYLKVMNRKSFHGLIHLFQRYGFSGSTREIRRHPVNTLFKNSIKQPK